MHSFLHKFYLGQRVYVDDLYGEHTVVGISRGENDLQPVYTVRPPFPSGFIVQTVIESRLGPCAGVEDTSRPSAGDLMRGVPGPKTATEQAMASAMIEKNYPSWSPEQTPVPPPVHHLQNPVDFGTLCGRATLGEHLECTKLIDVDCRNCLALEYGAVCLYLDAYAQVLKADLAKAHTRSGKKHLAGRLANLKTLLEHLGGTLT